MTDGRGKIVLSGKEKMVEARGFEPLTLRLPA
jgi:hypothetical protein